MMTLKEIRKKILKGDFIGLFRFLGKDEKTMQPSEVAKIFLNLPASSAIKAFQSFPEKDKIMLFPYLDDLVQKQIISEITKEQASKILNSISSDDLLIFLSRLKGVELSETLDYLNEKNKKAAHNLLGYPKESVARLINTEFATLTKEMTIEQAMVHLRKYHQDTETANIVYVVDSEGKLVDDMPIRRLVLNEPGRKIEDIMDGFYVKLNIGDSKETAVDIFKQYDRAALPVTNDNNVLLGVITVDDVIDVEEEKNTKEMQRFGGVESLDYPYVKTPFFSLIRKRAGWLIILFLSEMLTATAMGHFQSELDAALVLSLFVPLIISSGGNSGSQAATLIIRAMALNETYSKTVVVCHASRDLFGAYTWSYSWNDRVDQNYDLAGISLGKLRPQTWRPLLVSCCHHCFPFFDRDRIVGNVKWFDDPHCIETTQSRSCYFICPIRRNTC